MKKVLLYSGGMDSWLIDKLWKPDLKVYINMNTKYSEQEIKRLKKYNKDIIIIDFPLGQWEREDAIIPLRNLYLLMVICNLTKNEDIQICIGATAGDRSLDQSKEFFNKAEDLLNYLYQSQHWIPEGKNIFIITDYKKYTKAELLKLYLINGGDIDKAFKESLSCYNPSNDSYECWNCKPCFRKFIAFSYNGYKFSDDINNKCLDYYRKYIQQEMNNNKIYRTPQEDLEIRTVIARLENR